MMNKRLDYQLPQDAPRQPATVPGTYPRAAFTLVELLAVVALISLLVGLSVGGTDVFRKRALTKAGDQVAAIFELARQQAMSSNHPTAVVLLTGADTAEAGRALTVLDYSVRTGWKQIQAWEVLPQGCCVEVGSSNLSDNTFVSASDPAGLPNANETTVVFQGMPVDSTEYAFRIFLPSGGLLNTSGTSARIQLLEGDVVAGVSRPRGKTHGYYRISLVTATGRSKIEY